MTGVIKTKNEKGFGFIAREGGEPDVFFHTSALVGVTFEEIKPGDNVTFEIGSGRDGRPAAENVSLA